MITKAYLLYIQKNIEKKYKHIKSDDIFNLTMNLKNVILIKYI